MSGVNLNFVATSNYCRGEVFINRGNKEENKEIFDYFYAMKDKIEEDFGGQLEWERMDDNVTSRIKKQLDGVSYFEESDWNKMNEFLIDVSVRMEKAFKESIKKLNNYWKNK